MTPRSAASRNVFASRNYRLVFFGALVSELGAMLYSFAVSFYILEISGSNAFVQGLYLAVCGAALLLFTPLGGVLGDRCNKARIMFLCDFGKGALILLATALMGAFRSRGAHIAILFTAGVLGSAIHGVFDPAAAALLPHIVEEDRLQQANACFSMKSAVQSILAVALAGVLYAALPVGKLFCLVGVFYLLSGVSEMFIRYEHVPSKERLSVRLALADMREGLVYLESRKALLALAAVILFINFFFAPIGGNFLPYFVKTDVALAPSYLLDAFLTPEQWTSVFSVLIGISSLAGSVILSARAQEDRCGRRTSLRLCAVSAVMLSLAAGYWALVARGAALNAFLLLLCLDCLLIGLLVTFINIPVSTTLMRVVDRDKLGKVSSILSVGSQGLVPVASVLAGAVLQLAGCAPLLLVCSLGFTAAALFGLFSPCFRSL